MRRDPRLLLAACAAIGTLGALAMPANANTPAVAGGLDPGFGSGGRVVTYFGGGPASAVAVQADGKIVVVGTANTFHPGQEEFALARYNANGTLDKTFGNGGRVTTGFGVPSAYGDAVAIQPDGKIVAAGEADARFALARYNANGTLDTTFSGDGRVITGFSRDAGALSVAITRYGRIVAAGSYGPGRFALARYGPTGTLDTTFDGDGKLVTPVGSDGVTGVALQGDGSIVAAGRSSTGFLVARYQRDGALDPTFGGDGTVTTAFGGAAGASGVAITRYGRIVAAGWAGGGFALARYNPDGTPDTTLDGDGKVTTTFASGSAVASGVAIQGDGKIVAAGGSSTASTSAFALARYNRDGSLDTSFSGDGKLTTAFTGGEAYAYGVAIQTDGKIVAAGGLYSTEDPSDAQFAVARYLG